MSNSSNNYPNLQLIIIDDDPIIRIVHKRIFKKIDSDYTPKTFSGATDAMVYLSKNSINNSDINYLVLLDINMPGVSGWDFLDELSSKSFQERVKVVMVTSSLSKSDQQKSLSYKNVIKYIDKPMTVEDLNHIYQLVDN